MLNCLLISYPPPLQGNVATRRLGTRPSNSASVSESQCHPPVMLPLCWCQEISPPLQGIPKRCHFDDVGTGLTSLHAFRTSSEDRSLTDWNSSGGWKIKIEFNMGHGESDLPPTPGTIVLCDKTILEMSMIPPCHSSIFIQSGKLEITCPSTMIILLGKSKLKFHVNLQWSFNRQNWN